MQINVIFSEISLFTISGKRDFAAKAVERGLANYSLMEADRAKANDCSPDWHLTTFKMLKVMSSTHFFAYAISSDKLRRLPADNVDYKKFLGTTGFLLQMSFSFVWNPRVSTSTEPAYE